MEILIWNIHAMATFGLLGLIWTVQVVVYPQFLNAGNEQWDAYHESHMTKITWVVGPLMLTEIISAVLLLLFPPAGLDVTFLWIFGLGLISLVWAVTGAISVPLHGQLTRAYNEEAMRRLVRSNWVRTLGWTARSIWVLSTSIGMGIGG